MSEPGAIAALVATCDRVAESLPRALVASACQRAGNAATRVASVGPSQNARYMESCGEAAGLVTDLTAVMAGLGAAAEHIRAFRARLG